MKILVAAATALEISLFREHYREHTKTDYSALEVDFLETGVGMLSCAVRLSSALSRQKYQLMIQAGIAGCFDHQEPLCKVYQVTEEAIGDLGVEENGQWKDVFDMNLVKRDDTPFVNGILPGFDLEGQWQSLLPAARAITVNEISSKPERIQQLIARYQPMLESMEGAAFHYVGNVFNIPFVQIRSTSNYVGERNKTFWKMKEAIISLTDAVDAYLKQLNKTL